MKPYYSDSHVTIYHGDCVEVLAFLHAAICDVVITDPPYSEYVQGKSRAGHCLPDKKAIDRARDFGFAALTQELRIGAATAIARLVRRWTLVFSDVESHHLWKEDLVRSGLQHVRCGAWVKLNCTPQFTGDRPAQGFEAITICHPPGRKRWNGGGRPAVWQHPIVQDRGHNGARLHTAQKPISLMKDLVSFFSDPGETVLDLFAGSGTTLRAAKDLGRHAIGIEIEERWCEIAAERMAQGAFPIEAAPSEKDVEASLGVENPRMDGA